MPSLTRPPRPRALRSFGGAGLHTLMASDDHETITGSRDKDGDQVTATKVG